MWPSPSSPRTRWEPGRFSIAGERGWDTRAWGGDWMYERSRVDRETGSVLRTREASLFSVREKARVRRSRNVYKRRKGSAGSHSVPGVPLFAAERSSCFSFGVELSRPSLCQGRSRKTTLLLFQSPRKQSFLLLSLSVARLLLLPFLSLASSLSSLCFRLFSSHPRGCKVFRLFRARHSPA